MSTVRTFDFNDDGAIIDTRTGEVRFPEMIDSTRDVRDQMNEIRTETLAEIDALANSIGLISAAGSCDPEDGAGVDWIVIRDEVEAEGITYPQVTVEAAKFTDALIHLAEAVKETSTA